MRVADHAGQRPYCRPSRGGESSEDAEAARSVYRNSGVHPGGGGGTMLPKVSAEIWVIGK